MGLACAASIVISSGAAHADKTTLTLSTQLGIDYLPILVMKHDRLIEKHAAALGLGAITVRLISLTGAAATNEALLSGSAAVDGGDSSLCAGIPINSVDQRGVMRPIDGNGLSNGNPVCDIGASSSGAQPMAARVP